MTLTSHTYMLQALFLETFHYRHNILTRISQWSYHLLKVIKKYNVFVTRKEHPSMNVIVNSFQVICYQIHHA